MIAAHKNPAEWAVDRLAPWAAALGMLTAGGFKIFDFLPFELGIQIVLAFILVAGTYSRVAPRVPTVVLRPLVIFAILIAINEARHGTATRTLGGMLSIYLVLSIFTMPRMFVRRLFLSFATLLGIFAAMALVQWAILVAHPSWLPLTQRVAVEHGDGTSVITHPIVLLGFTAPEPRALLGIQLPRIQSFMREPSHTAVFFVMPSLIAYHLDGARRHWWIYTIVPFCLLAMTGSVFFPLALALAMLPWVGRRKARRVATILPAVIIVGSIVVLTLALTTRWIDATTDFVFRAPLFAPIEGNTNAFDASRSIQLRLEEIRAFFTDFQPGIPTARDPAASIGFLTYAFVSASVPGLLLLGWVLFATKRNVLLLVSTGHLKRLVGTLMFATLTSAVLFDYYGWPLPVGFSILATLVVITSERAADGVPRSA